jgi:hypothetical protein
MTKSYSFATVETIKIDLPQFVEKIDKRWVTYGSDNLYPDFLATLYNRSAIHRTCILSKLDGVIGNGLSFREDADNYLIKRANPTESWNDVLEKVALDYLIYGGFAINIIWSNDGESISEFYHLDYSKVRSGMIDPETDAVDTYYYCSDWSNTRKFKVSSYPTYDPSKSSEEPSQILVYFNYQPALAYYPLPDYVGSVSDIQLDAEISKFHLSSIRNGLVPGLIISLNNGVPDTDEARAEIYDEITSAYRGTDNASKMMLMFNVDKEHAAEVTTVDPPNDNYFIELEKRITSRILTGHRISSPLLLGLYHEGGTGFSSNSDEIETAYEHFLSTVIKPIQKGILNVFNRLLYDKGIHDKELMIVPNRLVSAVTPTKAIE